MSASRHAANCGRPIAVDPARQRPKRDHAAAARRPPTSEAYANAALTHAARLPLFRLLEAAKGSSALARWRSLARISRARSPAWSRVPEPVTASRTIARVQLAFSVWSPRFNAYDLLNASAYHAHARTDPTLFAPTGPCLHLTDMEIERNGTQAQRSADALEKTEWPRQVVAEPIEYVGDRHV